MCNTLDDDSTEEVCGGEAGWAEEITRDDKAIIVTMHCWIHNVTRCNMHNNNPTERVNGLELYRSNMYMCYWH